MHIPSGHTLFTPMQKPAILFILTVNIPSGPSEMIFLALLFLFVSVKPDPAHFRIFLLHTFLNTHHIGE